MKASYAFLFLALFFTISRWNVSLSYIHDTISLTVSFLYLHFNHPNIEDILVTCTVFWVKVSFWHHQSPQRPRLDGDDGCSTWSVVHERQLTKTAFIIVFPHAETHTIFLHLDIKHSSERERKRAHSQVWKSDWTTNWSLDFISYPILDLSMT